MSTKPGKISQEKSLLTAEAFEGCNLGCVYCFRAKKDITQPTRTASDEELVARLLESPFFLKDRSPVSINCNFIDPFLPQTKDSTFHILEMLEARGLRNIVSLITKSSISNEEIRRLERLRNLNLEVCVSYSDMPREIEPVGNDGRIDFLMRLRDSRLKTLLFYRPLVVGWNTGDRNIRKALGVAKKARVDVIMVGGLLLAESIREYIQRRGFQVPEYQTEDKKKYLPGELRDKIFAVYRELGISIPMVRRTSCGRSVIRGIPDYNGHWIAPDKNCWPTCPSKQREICAAAKAPYQQDVRDNKTVTVWGDFSRHEKNFLRSNLGVVVDAVKLEKELDEPPWGK